MCRRMHPTRFGSLAHMEVSREVRAMLYVSFESFSFVFLSAGKAGLGASYFDIIEVVLLEII